MFSQSSGFFNTMSLLPVNSNSFFLTVVSFYLFVYKWPRFMQCWLFQEHKNINTYFIISMEYPVDNQNYLGILSLKYSLLQASINNELNSFFGTVIATIEQVSIITLNAFLIALNMLRLFVKYSKIILLRSSRERCSMKNGVLRNLAKFTENTCARASFFKKETLAHMFSFEFCEIPRKPFSQNTSGQLLLSS